VPTANTLVPWVNENAFVLEVQTQPCPTLGRPVHLGFPHRLRPGTSPHALRIPPHGGQPALRSTTSSGFRSALAVSSFRLRARLDVSIPSAFFGQRGITPAFGHGAPHSRFERQRDFNPPEQRAAQRALPACRLQRRCPVVVNSSRCHGANVTMRTLTKPALQRRADRLSAVYSRVPTTTPGRRRRNSFRIPAK